MNRRFTQIALLLVTVRFDAFMAEVAPTFR
jgi:hypothetical protein